MILQVETQMGAEYCTRTYGYTSKTDIRAENQTQNAALIFILRVTKDIVIAKLDCTFNYIFLFMVYSPLRMGGTNWGPRKYSSPLLIRPTISGLFGW